MSTKAIREALSKLHRLMPVASGCIPEALAEVEAIEKAAKAWWESESKRGRGMVAHEAAATLERIAKEAP